MNATKQVFLTGAALAFAGDAVAFVDGSTTVAIVLGFIAGALVFVSMQF